MPTLTNQETIPFLPSNLTEAQKKALALDKNIFVEASAGSGKTTILVNRILKILWKNPEVELGNVLAITFTKKAASEMLLRIQDKMQVNDNDGPELTAFKKKVLKNLFQAKITTIHGFCHSLIKTFPLDLKVNPDVNILESDKSDFILHNSIIRAINKLKTKKSNAMKLLFLNWSYSAIIKIMKKCIYSRETVVKWAEKQKTQALLDAIIIVFRACSSEYQEYKEKNNLLDYHDLISMALHALENYPYIRNFYHKTLEYILVDEFQDTDLLQWDLIRLLSSSNNLFLVGDRFQSIYSFRGTHPRLFQDILKAASIETTIIIKADENFRTCKTLIDFINPFFQKLFDEGKTGIFDSFNKLQCQRNDSNGGKVEFTLISKENQSGFKVQADYIADWILKGSTKSKTLFGDYAILMRRKKQMEFIKKELVNKGIPAQVYAGTGLFKKAEIQDIYNLIKAITNPTDDLAWLGVLKSPIFDISDELLLFLEITFPKVSILKKLKAIDNKVISEWKAKGLDQNESKSIIKAKELIGQWLYLSNIKPLPQLIEYILEESGGWDQYSGISEQAVMNIEKLIRKLKAWHSSSYNNWQDIPKLLEHHLSNLNLEAEENIECPDDNFVKIMTIHAAKGLEFPCVILPELEAQFNFSQTEPLLISEKSGLGLSYKEHETQNPLRLKVYEDHKKQVIDEEKRIFYVACTRAEDSLLLLGQEKKRKTDSYLSFLTNCPDIKPDYI